MTPTPPDPAAALLDELTRCGIQLQAHGDRIRYRPHLAMKPHLAARVQAHKAALLAILAGDGSPTPTRADARIDREFARFWRVCKPWPNGRGWYDPTHRGIHGLIQALARLDRIGPGGCRERPPELLSACLWGDRHAGDGGNAPAGNPSRTECTEPGYVNPGWTPAAWAGRLRYLAGCCEGLRPDLAQRYRAWADNVIPRA